METFELIVALTAVIVALVWLADRIKVPYPMLLMIGGLVLAVLPWTPTIELDPEIVLVIFLPPILFQAAQTTSIRNFKLNFQPITRLAVGLVVVTTALVALVAHTVIPGIGWPAAFVLGAVVSPPDAVAATAIFQRLGAPKHIVTVLEGESLINDASAIVVYTFAVAAVVTGSFSFGSAMLEFLIVVIVGVLVGFLMGRVLGRTVMILGDPSLSMTVMLIAPVGAYVIAESLGGSGVLAVVVMGLIHGYFSTETMSPATRLRSLALWELVTILVNGFVFILIGLELGALRETLSRQRVTEILWHAFAVLLAMIAARFLYVFAGIWSRSRRTRSDLTRNDLKYQFVIAWSGLRGVVSLATALALPLIADNGMPFDHRDEIILITAVVIVVTLFGFGMPLPWILRKLRFAEDDSYADEMALARKTVRSTMYQTLLRAIDESPELRSKMEPMLKQLQSEFDQMTSLSETKSAEQIHDIMEPRVLQHQKAINAARMALLELWDNGRIGDEVRREVERNLDLQELQLT